MKEKRVPWYDTAGFVAWFLLIAVLTLEPAVVRPSNIASLCLLCGEVGVADLVRNILLFAPGGLFLSRRGISLAAAIGIGFAISTSIEIAQLFIPGRFSTLRDVLTNGLGAGAGAVFYTVMAHGVKTGSRLVLVAASVLPIIAVAATGWLMHPVSTDGVYFGHWVPVRPYYAPWNGRLLQADVDGLLTRSGPLGNTDEVRAALEQGRPLRVRFIQGDPPPAKELSALFHIVDDSQREVLMIGVSGSDLVIRPRLRATDARLDITDQRFVDFFAGTSPGDTIALEVATDSRGRSCASTGGLEACARYPSIGAAWQLILWNGNLPELARRALHGATVLLLLLPLSVLSVKQPRAKRLVLFVATAVATALVGRVSGLAWPGVAELLAVALLMPALFPSQLAAHGSQLPLTRPPTFH